MANGQHHIIFVPGILDDYHKIQSRSILFWRLFGVFGHCHVMPWRGNEDYEPKAQRLRELINDFLGQGHTVSLIGASAGASAVLNIYIERPDKIRGVALICPKINHPETVRQATYAANPAFKTSLEILNQNLIKYSVASKSLTTTYFSRKDGLIPYDDIHIPGVRERALPGLKHGYAIFYALTLGSFSIISRLKRQASD